jgi:hypothetical protein
MRIASVGQKRLSMARLTRVTGSAAVRAVIGVTDALEPSVDRYQTMGVHRETSWPQATERGPLDMVEYIAVTFGHRRSSVDHRGCR